MSRAAMVVIAIAQVRTLVAGAVADVLQESHGQRVPTDYRDCRAAWREKQGGMCESREDGGGCALYSFRCWLGPAISEGGGWHGKKAGRTAVCIHFIHTCIGKAAAAPDGDAQAWIASDNKGITLGASVGLECGGSGDDRIRPPPQPLDLSALTAGMDADSYLP